MRIRLPRGEAAGHARRQSRGTLPRRAKRSTFVITGAVLACAGLSLGGMSAGPTTLAASSTALSAERAPQSPEVGMQDGWIDRGGAPGTPTYTQGCDSNEENSDASPVPPPVFRTIIPTAVDDGTNWTNLKIHYERITVPWDIAYHDDHLITVAGKSFDPNLVLAAEQACLNYWLADIEAFNEQHPGLRVQPEIQLRPDYNHLGTGVASHRITAPSLPEYRAAMNALTKAYSCGASASPLATCPLPPDPTSTPYPAGTPTRIPRVETLTPWGEPDFQGQKAAKPAPDGVTNKGDIYLANGKQLLSSDQCRPSPTAANCGPVLAAQMWVAAYHRCRNCTVIAGTFGSAYGKDLHYLPLYVTGLGKLRPRVWAIDDYTDVWARYEQPCLQRYGRNAPSCPVPDPKETLLYSFSSWLRNDGYTAATTRIWLGEISVFDINSFKPHLDFGPTIEHYAADYLLKDLAAPGSPFTAPGAPIVQRLYYMRYEDGAGDPDFALVLDKNGSEDQVPAYSAFRYRTDPQ